MHSCLINGVWIGEGSAPVIMGVINCSPESFFSGSYVKPADVFSVASRMVDEGAALVDIGARSTAPGAPAISGKTESVRITKALGELDGSGITVSVDTMSPGVLAECLRHDIHAVNDIGGLSNPHMGDLVAESGVPAFLMAAKEKPGDAIGVQDTMAALEMVVQRCGSHGIDQFVLDPGIGLWTPLRTIDHDWELCRHFQEFTPVGRPLMAAISRKTFIGSLLVRTPDARLSGSLALTTLLLQKGAHVVRTHDVAETRDALLVFSQMEKRQ